MTSNLTAFGAFRLGAMVTIGALLTAVAYPLWAVALCEVAIARAAPRSRYLTPAEFEAAVSGRTAAEVKAALGLPDEVRGDSWLYHDRVVHPNGLYVYTATADFDANGKARAWFPFKWKR